MSNLATMTCWGCGHDVSGDRDHNGYAKCSSCGLRFQPSGEAPRDVYVGEYFEQYRGGDYVGSEAERRHEARVRLDLLPSPGQSGGRLLEIGSAAGFFLDEASRVGWRVSGVEPSAEMAGYSVSRFGVDVEVGFAEDLDLAHAQPDIVCAWHSLEHIPDPLALLTKIREALSENGAMVVEVPNGASIRARRLGENWIGLQPDVHVAQWTPAGLKALFERAGFSRVETTTVPFLVYRGSWAAKAPRRILLAIRQRRWIREPHPEHHELLRAVAIR